MSRHDPLLCKVQVMQRLEQVAQARMLSCWTGDLPSNKLSSSSTCEEEAARVATVTASEASDALAKLGMSVRGLH